MVDIRYLLTRDIPAVKSIADANRETLGFLPKMKLKEAAEQERCLVAIDRDVVVGFVIYRHRKIDAQTTLSDICVDAASRRHGVGFRLIQHLVRDCETRGRDFIQLKCPEGLAANAFYEHLGFKYEVTEPGKSRRLVVWRMPIGER